MTKTNEKSVVATKARDLEVGQELYDFYLDDSGHAKMSKVYVIKKNKTNFYFSYNKYDRTNSHMRLKATGTLPKMWRSSFIELHYISDDNNFGERWEKQIEQRRYYKDKIDSIKNEIYSRNDVSELKGLYEMISFYKHTKSNYGIDTCKL